MRQIIQADEQKRLMRWLKEQGAPQKHTIILLSLLSVCAFVAQVVLFWQLAEIAQILIVDNRSFSPEWLFPSLGFLALSMLVLLIIERVKVHLSERAERALFSALQSQLWQRLSQGQYALTRQHSTYFWQNIWLSYMPTVAEFNMRYLVQQRFVMAVPLIVIACVLPLNWMIAVSLLLSLPIVPLFMIVIGKGAAALHQRHFKALSRLGSIFVDRLKALTLLRIFDAHDRQAGVLSSASDSLNQRTMRVVGVAFLSATVLDFFSTLAVALVAVFVGFNLLGEFTLGGQLTLHTGLFLLLVAPLCFAELKQLGRLYHLRAEAIAVADTLEPLLSAPLCDAVEIIDAHAFSTLEWQDMTIPVPALHAQRLRLTKGDWVWLQGDSGSGKTCFLESLMGQRPASHSFRNAVLVSQHAVIMPFSIRDNVALGRQVSDERILDALARVELDDWLSQQEHGLDTLMGEHVPMSGGQQQRLALARVLLMDAPVVFFDEPTAHLTDEQHQRLSAMIRQVFMNTTVIWASHKPLQAEWFNQQWVVHSGEVVVS